MAPPDDVWASSDKALPKYRNATLLSGLQAMGVKELSLGSRKYRNVQRPLRQTTRFATEDLRHKGGQCTNSEMR